MYYNAPTVVKMVLNCIPSSNIDNFFSGIKWKQGKEFSSSVGGGKVLFSLTRLSMDLHKDCQPKTIKYFTF